MKQKVLYCVLLIALMYQFGNSQIAPKESVDEKLELEKKDEPILEGMLLRMHGFKNTVFEIGYFRYNWVNEASKIPIIGGFGYSATTEHYINENYHCVKSSCLGKCSFLKYRNQYALVF
jgi:hypothetical protein